MNGFSHHVISRYSFCSLLDRGVKCSALLWCPQKDLLYFLKLVSKKLSAPHPSAWDGKGSWSWSLLLLLGKSQVLYVWDMWSSTKRQRWGQAARFGWSPLSLSMWGPLCSGNDAQGGFKVIAIKNKYIYKGFQFCVFLEQSWLKWNQQKQKKNLEISYCKSGLSINA